MSKFKEEFEKCVMCHYLKDNLVRNKHKWDELFCLSDDPVSKNDKRNEEDESDYSKQLSSLQYDSVKKCMRAKNYKRTTMQQEWITPHCMTKLEKTSSLTVLLLVVLLLINVCMRTSEK